MGCNLLVGFQIYFTERQNQVRFEILRDGLVSKPLQFFCYCLVQKLVRVGKAGLIKDRASKVNSMCELYVLKKCNVLGVLFVRFQKLSRLETITLSSFFLSHTKFKCILGFKNVVAARPAIDAFAKI
jgi:hypothetical protein